jgi:hypothetical protein
LPKDSFPGESRHNTHPSSSESEEAYDCGRSFITNRTLGSRVIDNKERLTLSKNNFKSKFIDPNTVIVSPSKTIQPWN